MKLANETLYIPIVGTAFLNAGLDAAFGCAIARQESGWDPSATASNPKDIARGGAFGLCQMTLLTAQALGHTSIAIHELLDPAINASIAAELCKSNLQRLTGVTYADGRSPSVWDDLAAMYNSGRRYQSAPHITQTNYVPAVNRYMVQYAHDPRVLALGSRK